MPEEADISDLDRTILEILAATSRLNAQAEVPMEELRRASGSSQQQIMASVRSLAARGLISGDLLPINVWLRVTEEGIAFLEASEGQPGIAAG